jgi:hypothetical protein
MKKGGGPFPLKYYNSMAVEPSAAPGRDLLYTVGNTVRSAIPIMGGNKRGTRSKRNKRGTRNKRNKRGTRDKHGTCRKRGGFVPSVMGGFVEAASKYIVPLALFAGYKLMTKKKRRMKY